MARDLDFRWRGGFPDYAQATLGPAGNGFFGLEDEWAAISSGQMAPTNRDLAERVSRRRQDMQVVERRAERIRKLTAGGRHARAANPAHLSRLQALIRRADQQGVRLIYLIAPRGGVVSHFDRQALKAALPDERVIDLSDPEEFPQFHDPELSFDRAHLNAEGARIFSLEVARQARERLSGNSDRD